jgi:hypothetical protein
VESFCVAKIRNQTSAPIPDNANPKTNAGWRPNRTNLDAERLNPPTSMMPVFINKFAAAMQIAEMTTSVNALSVTVFALQMNRSEAKADLTEHAI